MQKVEKYLTCSVYEYKEDGWRAQFNYMVDGKRKKKTKTLRHKGRDKGKRTPNRDAALREAEEHMAWLNDEIERAKKEAERAEKEALEAPKKRVLSDYLADYIAEQAISVEPSTVDGYRHLAKNAIGAYIGDVELRALQPDVVSKWMLDAMEKYSAATVRKAFVLLRAALRQACSRHVIPEDPTRGLKAPRLPTPVSNSLTEADRGAVLAYANIKPTRPICVAIRMALYTGMRRGEMCALRWRNVNLDSMTLRVTEALGKASKDDVGRLKATPTCFSGVYIKEPKNKASNRTVYFPEDLANVLRARKALMEAQCKKADISFSENMYVLGTIEGYETKRGGNNVRDYVPMNPHTLWGQWHAITEELEIVGTEGKAPAFHDLRHTFATTAVASRIDIKTISSSMGHTNTAMTLNRYTSADPDAQRRAADRMGEVYGACLKEAQSAAEILELGKAGTDE